MGNVGRECRAILSGRFFAILDIFPWKEIIDGKCFGLFQEVSEIYVVISTVLSAETHT